MNVYAGGCYGNGIVAVMFAIAKLPIVIAEGLFRNLDGHFDFFSSGYNHSLISLPTISSTDRVASISRIGQLSKLAFSLTSCSERDATKS